jgi:hypothetical protein
MFWFQETEDWFASKKYKQKKISHFLNLPNFLLQSSEFNLIVYFLKTCPNLLHGVWGLGFGVWGLGFGVWGLGFGVWGLGFGVRSYLTPKFSTSFNNMISIVIYFKRSAT